MFADNDDELCESFDPIDTQDFEDFGTCCVCGCEPNPERPVHNFICLDFKAPNPGHGWGCAVCGLPPNGAVAVICDRCLEEQNFAFKWICGEFGKDETRLPYPENPEEFKHDETKHKEFEMATIGTVSDPSWDYAEFWQQLSGIFKELSQLQCYVTDQEQATVESDLHIYTTVKDVATKLNAISDLLVHPVETDDEF